ncbi:response regulator [Merismopedia glauca]|uniref:Two-component system response regulator n=1 Tax=Merismopedia glauca CCAP 1448/3 TaxID=1296344 RepID=A0A2T1CAB9_9CYAN|nr:response regulator [Merismopedia glauca]PSB05108.1 two-component system response regulator [Merismopedia glauca CCAP 1448/3]
MASQKVLIIDDGKTIRMQIKDMLPSGNFQVLEAKDGMEGLSMIREERPNLILLDCFMPRMNGWEVLDELEAQKDLVGIPLIIMSGRKEEAKDKIPHLDEAFEFLEKPFDQKTLIAAIKSAVAKAKWRQKNGGSSYEQTVSSSQDAKEINQLKATVNALVQQNIKLQSEVEQLKKQVNQIVTFIKQKMG